MKKISPLKHLYTNIHSDIIQNSQKMERKKNKTSPKSSSTPEWINEIRCIKEWNIIEQQKEAMIQATTWMNLKSIMIGERSQIQKATYYMTEFISNVQNRLIY